MDMRQVIIKYAIIVSALLLLCSVDGKAQFEQKLTFQASGGFVAAIGPESFTDIFTTGFSIDAGAQYNFSRSTSIVAMAKYSTYFFFPDDEFNLESAKYNMLGLSLCPKFRFFTRSKVNPYLFAGASINYISISFSIDGSETRSSKTPTSIGIIGGLGVDFRINDNFALFYQAGYNWVDLDLVRIESVFQQVGVNISLFKSKSL